jgi:hypothetical protein
LAYGSVEVTIRKAELITLRVRVAVTVWAALSTTLTLNVEVPAEGAVPEMTPVVGFNTSPAGSEPWLIDQVYGLVPPIADSVSL